MQARILLLSFLGLACATPGCAHRPDPAHELSVLGAACAVAGGPTVDVLGAVAHPGRYPLVGDTTLRGAVLAAGGLTSLARPGGVRVTRCSRSVLVDLDAISDGQVADPPMRPGDEVIVPERVF